MELIVHNIKGKETDKKVKLDKSVFGIEPNDHAIYLDVKQYLANNRKGLHKAKERAEIAGSTRKIKKQKGTGTAKQIVITIVRKDLWKLRANQNIDFFNLNKENLSTKQYDQTKKYYTKAMPLVYKDFLGILGFSKYIFAYIIGVFKVMYRQLRSSDTRIVAHKSAALASQNFMISMSGFGYDTCPMEGFDSLKLKKLLKLNKKSEINMVIGCGIRSKEGVYGERFRIPFEEVYFQK